MSRQKNKDTKMYLWKSKKLVADLKNEGLSEKEKLKYMLFWGVATLIASDPILHVGNPYTSTDTIISILMFIITIIGTVFCYKANKNGDNTDFITRYVCLSIPIGIKAITFLILLLTILITIAVTLDFEVFEEGSITELVFEASLVTAFVVYIYYSLVKHFKLLSQ